MNGLIAFFDILGYQSFLENNSAEKSTQRVFDLIMTTPDVAKDTMSPTRYPKIQDHKELKEAHEAVKQLIFSDTIVLALAYPSDATERWKDWALTYLSGRAGSLCAAMFAEGLPLRGVIVEGDFHIREMCFAGKAIVEAYKLCESLDFSGLVYASDPALCLAKLRLKESDVNRFVVSYLSPLNNSNEKKMLHFNWLALLKRDKTKEWLADIETFVCRAFWAHNKDCPRSVDAKLANTVKLCRRLVVALESSS